MNTAFETTWETYVASWKAESAAEKRALFALCLDPSCEYTDPLTHVTGWDALATSMLDFHKQIPGAHFVTTYFLAHSRKSVARWNMVTSDGVAIGDGISFGEYNEAGRLIAMTGFFETPGAEPRA